LIIIDNIDSKEYYKAVIDELLACTFIKFEYTNYHMEKEENYYIFKGEV